MYKSGTSNHETRAESITSDMHNTRKRNTLTGKIAREIFDLKPPCHLVYGSDRVASSSFLLSQIYHVSPKAIRDIWNLRTWRHATNGESNMVPGTQSERQSADPLITTVPIPNLEFASKFVSTTSIEGQCEQEADFKQKQIGRPLGSKDKQPRRRRHAASVPQLSLSPAPICAPAEPKDVSPDVSCCILGSPMEVDDNCDEVPLCRTYPFFLSFDGPSHPPGRH